MSDKLSELMKEWRFQKEIENKAIELRRKTEIALYEELSKQGEVKEEGTTSFEADGLKLKVVGKYDYKVDQEKAQNHPDLFKVKYEYSKTILKTLTDEEISTVEDIVTKKVARPSFTVDLVEEK